MFLNILFKKKKRKTIKVQLYSATFVTIDNISHSTGLQYDWIAPARVLCHPIEYLMISIRGDEYIMDEKYKMYLLANVISIEWKLEKEAEIYENDSRDCFKSAVFDNATVSQLNIETKEREI